MARRLPTLGLALLALGTSQGLAQDGYAFGACLDSGRPQHQVGTLRSTYIPMRDGVKIAVDIVLPAGPGGAGRFPSVLHLTRYWRGGQGDPPSDAQRFFAANGYATVWMDVRGTGASGGIWRRSRSTAETKDYTQVVDWIRQQPWSDGQVVGWGLSYGANAADFLAAESGKRVGAIAPLFPDFDIYSDLLFPGGIFHIAFGRGWSDGVKAMDRNEPRPAADGRLRGVRPVDDDSGGTELARYLKGREPIPGIYEGYRQITYRDDNPPTWDGSLNERSTHAVAGRLEASGVPMLTWASWLDAGTAAGALHRFGTVRNSQLVIIGPWSHGARFSASPFEPVDAAVRPSVEEQRAEQLCFFDRALAGRLRRADRRVVYYTLGEEQWKTTPVWPPAGFQRRRYFLSADQVLSDKAPLQEIGADRYPVNFNATTGSTNRWFTQRGGGDVIYPDRAEADRALLTYTSAPMSGDVEITGTPWINLMVRSTHPDGAFFVYLEDVAPDGRVSYLTEGQLRAIHRLTTSGGAPYRVYGPYHSFRRRDARPLPIGRLAELEFSLHPTSVLIKQGHRIRVAIAGADRDTFARIPETGDPVISIERNRAQVSWISLPMKVR